MSLLKAFERTVDRGFVPYRKVQPEYKSLADQAMEFEKAVTLPKRIQELEERINSLELSLQIMRNAKEADPVKAYLAPLCSRIAQIEAHLGLERAQTKEPIDLPQIIVPHELRVLRGKFGKCNNRKIEVVRKRWALWRAQYEAGVHIATIARAWGCDRASIFHALKRGWVPSSQARHNNYPTKRKAAKK
jgi:hypothetical protein